MAAADEASRSVKTSISLETPYTPYGPSRRFNSTKTGKSFRKSLSTDSTSSLSSSFERYQARYSPVFAHCVILASNPYRRAWNVVVCMLLIYTATILPYRLCFVEFAIPDDIDTTTPWLVIQWTIDGLFWVDLFANFLFSYLDNKGNEITDFCLIARRYLRGYFLLNFIACLPSEAIAPLVEYVVNAFSTEPLIGPDNSVHKSMRLARLQRISRLARLMRLGRLTKLVAFIAENPVWQEIQSIRGVRVLNLFFGLMWAVHLVACGWYLTASLHEDPWETWVARRSVDAAGIMPLLNEGPMMKWGHSMYFVLTVFTTVGFGDMSALTTGEILYCCFTMLVGAVVQSIILSEVINIITSADQMARQVKEQKALVEEFSQHARLTPKTSSDLARWATLAHSAAHAFDRTRMRELLTSSALPRWLTGELPEALYEGQLIQNTYLTVCKGVQHQIPPRLPLLIALAVTVRHYTEKEVVYFCHDSSWNVFLVMSGTFVHIAKPFPSNPGPEDLSKYEVLAQKVKPASEESCGALESVVMSWDLKSFRAVSLSPYQIFGAGNHFGEAEIFLSPMDSCGARRSCARCDIAGDTLLLHKKDIANLVAEFPRSAQAWYHSAARRENHRQYLLHSLQMHETVQALAASIIQRHYRESRDRPGKSKLIESLITATQRVKYMSPAKFEGHVESVPLYARKMEKDIRDLHSEVAGVKSSISIMNANLQAVVDALRVKQTTI